MAGEWKSSFQTLLQTPGISTMYGQVKEAGLVDVSSGDGGVYPLLQAPLHHWVEPLHWLCRSWNKLLVRLARGELAPRPSLVSPKVFFSVLSPIKFWFLAVVASSLLSWGHLISSDITDLIAQILFKLNWTGQWHHWIQYWNAFNSKSFLFWYCAVAFTQFVLLKALYK